MLFENIQSLCKKRKITFAQLERELGFGNGTIRKWNTASPSVEKLERLADYFQVSTDLLLGRDQKDERRTV